jgi:hypothetical protein
VNICYKMFDEISLQKDECLSYVLKIDVGERKYQGFNSLRNIISLYMNFAVLYDLDINQHIFYRPSIMQHDGGPARFKWQNSNT